MHSRARPGESRTADYYDVLQISPRASQEVIQAAYRTLARSFHPDVNASPDAEARIRELNAAYAVLSDPAGRARYDFERARERRRPALRTRSSTSPGSRALPTETRRPVSTVGAARRSADPRIPVVGNQVILAMILLAAVLATALVVVWAISDDGSDGASVVSQPYLNPAQTVSGGQTPKMNSITMTTQTRQISSGGSRASQTA